MSDKEGPQPPDDESKGTGCPDFSNNPNKNSERKRKRNSDDNDTDNDALSKRNKVQYAKKEM